MQIFRTVTSLFLAGVLASTAMLSTVSANNHSDTNLPNAVVSYYVGAGTASRAKQDKSSTYINNRSGFVLNTRVFASANSSNQTKGGVAHINTANGKRLIRQYVYENGYRSCYMGLWAGKTGIIGRISGLWSPDSVGSYTYAN